MYRRRAISVVELLVAVVMLTALLAVLAQLLAVVAVQRRHAARRLAAVEEAANVMERVAALEFAEIETDRLGKMSLSAEAKRLLPSAELTVEVTPENMGPEDMGTVTAKRVAVEVRWENRAGQTNRPIRLTAWRYPDNETSDAR